MCTCAVSICADVSLQMQSVTMQLLVPAAALTSHAVAWELCPSSPQSFWQVVIYLALLQTLVGMACLTNKIKASAVHCPAASPDTRDCTLQRCRLAS